MRFAAHACRLSVADKAACGHDRSHAAAVSSPQHVLRSTTPSLVSHSGCLRGRSCRRRLPQLPLPQRMLPSGSQSCRSLHPRRLPLHPSRARLRHSPRAWRLLCLAQHGLPQHRLLSRMPSGRTQRDTRTPPGLPPPRFPAAALQRGSRCAPRCRRPRPAQQRLLQQRLPRSQSRSRTLPLLRLRLQRLPPRCSPLQPPVVLLRQHHRCRRRRLRRHRRRHPRRRRRHQLDRC